MFGFDSLKDMFDGGGAGQSGDSFSTEGSSFDKDGVNNYTEKGGTGAQSNNYSSDSFISNTVSDVSGFVSNIFSNTTDYQVKSGDTLSEIAAANNTTVEALMEANPNITDPNKIYAGDTINIVKTSKSGSTTTSSGDSDGGSSASYGTNRLTIDDSSGGTSGDGSTTGELSAQNILSWAKTAGVVKSNADIDAMLADPAAYLSNKGINLTELVQSGALIDPNAAGTVLDPSDPRYNLEGDMTYNVTTGGEAMTADDQGRGPATFYAADTVSDRIAGNAAANVDAVTGTIRDENLVNAEDFTIDITGAATGVNADGTTSVVGEALNDYASINTSMIIDTTTVAGKLLAQKLQDEGKNYVDSKSTLLGQMKIISDEFKDSNGNPIIPPWAQGMARDLQRTMAFQGVTGTAATAAMSNAIMEATLGVAEKEAAFFQTLTVKNLDNQQQAIINKANILSKFELANLDARQAAAVQNAKAFMEMDLQNLSNEQQAEVINTQSMVQALFNDQAAINAERVFGAQTANEFQQFYDKLQVQVQTFNAEQVNAMKRFNAGEINDAAEFNSTMEDSRQRFYATMQYNIDLANAKWRQDVTTTNSQMMFDAYSADVKNAFDLNQEGLNQMWDRVDNMLDYIFKGAQTEAQLEAQILAAQISAAANKKSSSSGIWGAVGSIGAAAITAF